MVTGQDALAQQPVQKCLTPLLAVLKVAPASLALREGRLTHLDPAADVEAAPKRTEARASPNYFPNGRAGPVADARVADTSINPSPGANEEYGARVANLLGLDTAEVKTHLARPWPRPRSSWHGGRDHAFAPPGGPSRNPA